MTSFLGIGGMFEGLEDEFSGVNVEFRKDKGVVSEAILASFEVVFDEFYPEEDEFSGVNVKF